MNHDRLKGRTNRGHDDDGIDIGGNVRNFRVLVLHNDAKILPGDVEQFQFLLQAWFGRDYARVGRWWRELEGEVGRRLCEKFLLLLQEGGHNSLNIGISV